MQSNASSRRLRAVSLVTLGVLVLGRLASPQNAQPEELDAKLGRIGDALSLPVVFEGVVLEPDGTPAEGAVVVSSAGEWK